MHTLGKLALTVVAWALMTSPAWTQGTGGIGMGGLGGGPFLLLAPNVQGELKVPAEQARTLPRTIQQIVNKHSQTMIELRNLKAHEQIAKQRGLIKAMNEEAKKALSLSPEQSRRFDQICLQQRGIEAFSDPEIEAGLMLVDDQKAKIREIGNASLGRFQEIAQGLVDDREGAIRKIRQLQKDLMDKALAVLNDGQKESWKEMAGEPFEVRFERRG